MPHMDMRVALTNPSTLDRFDVHRTRQIINSFGEVRNDIVKIKDQRGVVVPESLNDLSRRAEAQLTTKSIVVITRFPLRGESNSSVDGGSFQPDRIKWNRNHFLVVHVEDYSNYAAGFVKCTATSTDIVDEAPQTRGGLILPQPIIIEKYIPVPSVQIVQAPPQPVISGPRYSSIQIVIDGGGLTPANGSWGNISVPFACTILGWTITADQVGSAIVDVQRGTYSGFPVVSSITGGQPIVLNSAQKAENLGVAGIWTTAINVGDILEFFLDSAGAVTRLNISLNISIP